jgi:hypothetical protein
MVQIVAIGIAAGAAAALVFAALVPGSTLSLLLVSITPTLLPILIAALGWGHLAGLIAAFVAAMAAAATLTDMRFVTFLVSVGLPAWWLGYLTLLGRPAHEANANGTAAPQANADEIEWYPVGRLVVWGALLAALAVIIGVLNNGWDAESIRSKLTGEFEQFVRYQNGIPADAPLEITSYPDPSGLLDLLAAVLPPTAAVLATIANLMNLWLAARIVKISGRLKRPWPDLAAMAFPPLLSGALAAAVAASFLDGLAGILAGVLGAALLTAYAILGFAVLHKITSGMSGRGFVLAGVYTAVGVLGWPMLMMTLLGLADSVIDLRGRVAARRGTPSPRS